MSTEEIQRLALELDPIVHTDDWGEIRLSFAVDSDGWAGAYDRFPEVRRFLDRLGAMVAENDAHRMLLQREAALTERDLARARTEKALETADEARQDARRFSDGVVDPAVLDDICAALTGEEAECPCGDVHEGDTVRVVHPAPTETCEATVRSSFGFHLHRCMRDEGHVGRHLCSDSVAWDDE